VQVTAEFGLDTFNITHGIYKISTSSVFAMAYAVKAVKRNYA
jgi:hypothetical protein